MIQRHKTRDTATGFIVLEDLEAVPCVLCGGEAMPQRCPGDGANHHHGQVHRQSGGLVAVCDKDMPLIESEWSFARSFQF